MTTLALLLAAGFATAEPVAPTPAVSDLTSSTTLTASSPGVVEAWSGASLLKTYRRAIRASRDLRLAPQDEKLVARLRDEATTGTLPQAYAALLALRENNRSVELLEDRRKVLSTFSQYCILHPPQPFALGTIIAAPLEQFRSISPERLTDMLLADFESDAVEGNAAYARRIFDVGITEDPARFLPAVARRVLRDRRELEEGFPAWSLSTGRVLVGAWQQRMDKPAAERVDWPADARLALDLLLSKFAVRGTIWRFDDDFNVAEHLRRRVWRVLIEGELRPDCLATIVKSGEATRDDITGALALIMRSEPELYHRDEYADLLVEGIAQGCYSYDLWRTIGPSSDGDETGIDYQWICGQVVQVPISKAQRAVAPFVMSAVRRHIEKETSAWRQMNLCRFLSWDEAMESRVLAATVAASNMEDDGNGGNAVEAAGILNSLPSEVTTGVELAALNVGLEMRDWQIVTGALELLARNGEPLTAEELPQDLVPFLIEQLADDTIEGNSAAARHALVNIGAAALPALHEAAQDGDEQQQYGASLALRLIDENAE